MRTYLHSVRIANMAAIRRVLEAAQPGEELTVELAVEALDDKTGRILLIPD